MAVDFIQYESGQWYLLEVNTVPEMTPTSLMPKAAQQVGYNFDLHELATLQQTI